MCPVQLGLYIGQILDSWKQIEERLLAVAAEAEGAWRELLLVLTPAVERLAMSQPIGRLRDDEDARRDIVAMVLGKLHGRGARAIKNFADKDDSPPVEAWIRVLVRSAAIDVMRGRPEFQRAGKRQEARWFSLATLVTQEGTPADTLVAKRREVERFMERSTREAREELRRTPAQASANLAAAWQIPILHTRRLVKRIELYEPILLAVLAGHSYVEVAEMTGLSRREVELIVGYIEEFFHSRGFAD